MKPQCFNCLATVSDRSRVRIIDYLRKVKKEINVSQVVEKLELRQPTVTFHINKLVKSGIVAKRRDGRQAFLKLHYLSRRCAACPVFD